MSSPISDAAVFWRVGSNRLRASGAVKGGFDWPGSARRRLAGEPSNAVFFNLKKLHLHSLATIGDGARLFCLIEAVWITVDNDSLADRWVSNVGLCGRDSNRSPKTKARLYYSLYKINFQDYTSWMTRVETLTYENWYQLLIAKLMIMVQAVNHDTIDVNTLVINVVVYHHHCHSLNNIDTW